MSSAAIAGTSRWGLAWRRAPARLAMAAVVVAALVDFGVTAHGLTTAFLLAVLVALAVIDVERRVLPNAIVGPAAALVMAAQLTFFPGRAVEWIVAAVGAAGVLLAFSIVNPAGMGMGDVKLAFLIGAGMGSKVIVVLIVASLAVWPFALALFARYGIAARKHAIPFGPFLAFGTLVVALLSSGSA
jgi:leader peptidase (prepilin peptidase) / N-methyltransferase